MKLLASARFPASVRRSALACLSAAVAAAQIAVAGAGAASSAEPAPSVILVSLDGTTPAAVRSAELPTLAELTRRGAAASRLVPVFPTNTFPNHVTLVTGVVPEVHGIVNNVFLDPLRGPYSYSNDPTWIEVEPLWAIAARNGVVSAAYHWVGSEGPWRNGYGPRHWKSFDSDTPASAKVEQILAWLDLEDPDERPRLVTSWFRGADAAAHRFGPDSRQVRAELRSQDRALARLVEGLEHRRAFATTTLLVVSDHGMAPVSRRVDLAAALEERGIEASVFGGGGFVTVSLAGRGAEAARVIAVARSLGLNGRVPGSASPDLPLDHPRFGDVAVLAPVGTAISSRLGRPLRGSHGYAPTEPSMGGILIAAGRGVRPGTRLAEVASLDVAPTLLVLLGILPPEQMKGRPVPGLVTGVDAPALDPAEASLDGDAR